MAGPASINLLCQLQCGETNQKFKKILARFKLQQHIQTNKTRYFRIFKG